MAKYFIDGLESDTFRLRKTNVIAPAVLPNEPMYAEVIPILETKMRDLKSLQQYIPSNHSLFWEEIYKWPVETASGREERIRNT